MSWRVGVGDKRQTPFHRCDSKDRLNSEDAGTGKLGPDIAMTAVTDQDETIRGAGDRPNDTMDMTMLECHDGATTAISGIR